MKRGTRERIVIEREKTDFTTFLGIYKGGIRIENPTEVIFSGEEGIDADGLSREYFTLLINSIYTSDMNIFEGEPEHLIPVFSVWLLTSRVIYYIGLMLRRTVLQRCTGLTGVSEAFVDEVFNMTVQSSALTIYPMSTFVK